ncbi:zinc dependent phospholipase C family protein [Granulicella arctica]|uniref:zinc dependent phospholipase C family protein n=1 Tax=Granulicella arctica TaxID=940613 RepID=UPI0021DF7355|nr:zinc dependent phospholipase C family protein [Granulicella arctica]
MQTFYKDDPLAISSIRSAARLIKRLAVGSYVRVLALTLLALTVTPSREASGYSFLTHEQLIDLTWKASIRPLLLQRYPKLTRAEVLTAHAYAYGGSAIQDVGYYPGGDKFFSDLTHYVRSGDFITALFRNAHNANELAFAIGALSHYVGDVIGHPDATNVAVPLEFPKLAARYGPVVNYAQAEHPHVQTEFAFDINEIANHRFAPAAYLKHIGLAVPVKQLATAYYETYGIGGEYASGRRRLSLSGYRFAVRSLLPRVAFAETVLHRKSFPIDSPGPEIDLLKKQLAQADFENGWDQYRKKPGIGTYSLAGFIYVVPKFGPLKLLAIKGPTSITEDDYVRSFNLSIIELRHQLTRVGTADHAIPNRDLDTGAKVKPGGYRLTDDTYAKLLRELTSTPDRPIPPGIKTDIAEYYADPSAPIVTKKNPKRWAEVQHDLTILASMKTTTLPPDIPDQPDVPPPTTPTPEPGQPDLNTPASRTATPPPNPGAIESMSLHHLKHLTTPRLGSALA